MTKQDGGGMVTVYDMKSKKKYMIPAAELAPGMVLANVEGVGEVWIEASQAKEGRIVFHPPFEGGVKALVEEIHATFSPLPFTHIHDYEGWEDGFRHDINAWSEVRIWVWMARAFHATVGGRTLDDEQKSDIYKVILACTNDPGKVESLVSVRTLSKTRIRQIVETFLQGAALTDAEKETLSRYANERAEALRAKYSREDGEEAQAVLKHIRTPPPPAPGSA